MRKEKGIRVLHKLEDSYLFEILGHITAKANFTLIFKTQMNRTVAYKHGDMFAQLGKPA